MAKHKIADENISIREVIQGLKDKTLSARDIPEDKKALTIGYLHFDGLSHPQLAELFGVSEKSIQRGMRHFKEMMAISPELQFIKREVGYFLSSAENQVGALLRIARSPNSTASEKIIAENSAWRIRVDVISKLQSIGYLPIQSQHIDADLFHHLADSPEQTPDEMRKVIEGIEQDAKESGVLSSGVKTKIEAIRLKIQKFEVTREIVDLKNETESKGESDE